MGMLLIGDQEPFGQGMKSLTKTDPTKRFVKTNAYNLIYNTQMFLQKIIHQELSGSKEEEDIPDTKDDIHK